MSFRIKSRSGLIPNLGFLSTIQQYLFSGNFLGLSYIKFSSSVKILNNASPSVKVTSGEEDRGSVWKKLGGGFWELERFFFLIVFLAASRDMRNLSSLTRDWRRAPTMEVQTPFSPNLFIYFWLCLVFAAVRAFSCCSEWGLLSSCSVRASLCGDWTLVSCPGRQIPYSWATRETRRCRFLTTGSPGKS